MYSRMDLISHHVCYLQFLRKQWGDIGYVKVLRNHLLMMCLVSVITEFDWLAGWTQGMAQ